MEALKGRKVCFISCYVDPRAPLTGCPPQSPAVRITPCQWGAHMSRLLVISFKTELQERLTSLSVSLLFLLLTKGLRTRISSHELGTGKWHGCREKVPLPSALILKGLAVQAHLSLSYILVSGTFIFPSSICFVSFWIFFFSHLRRTFFV